MADVPPLPIDSPISNYKDRKTGLTVFGVLEIVLGCLTAALAILMVVGQLLAARSTQEPPQFRMIIPSVLFYGFAAAALITLGIGSLMARRWARALSLVFSWLWLITGVIVMVFMVFFLPSILQNLTPGGGPGLPPAALKAAILSAMVLISLMFILVPGVLVLFYQSRHVRATCETRDPVRRWTDACPLPVLGLSLWIGLAALYLLVMPFSMNGIFPFFGVLLSGWSGSLVYLAVAALWGYSARALYRLEVGGWWIVVVSLILFSVSAWVSFSRIELLELFQQIGYSDAQIQMMERFNIQGHNIGYWSLVSVVPLLGYLLLVKRYFRGPLVR